MILHSLSLRNFRQHADTRIDFEAGVTGIIGTNGAGKSTILEAVAYALYGSEATRGTKGSIRWNRAPARKQAEVSLEFSTGGKRYTVSRNESTAVLVAVLGRVEAGEGGAVTKEHIASGISAVDAAIPDLLGMTYKEFASTFLCSQKDLARLASMGGAERQQFFRSVMGVGRVDEAVIAARRSKNDLARERDGLAAGLGEREPLHADLWDAAAAQGKAQSDSDGAAADLVVCEDRMQATAADLEKWTEKRTRFDWLSRDIEQAEREFAEAEAQIGRLSGAIGQAEAAAQRVAAKEGELDRLPGLRKRRDALVEARSTAHERGRLIDAVARLEHEVEVALDNVEDAKRIIAAYNADAHDGVRGQVVLLEGRLAKLEAERRQDREGWERALHMARAEEDRLIDRMAKLEELGTDGDCPTCTRPLGDYYDEVIGGLEQEHRAARTRAEEARVRMAALAHPSEEEEEVARDLDALRSTEQVLVDRWEAMKEAAKDEARWRQQVEQKRAEVASARERLAALSAAEYSEADLDAVEAEIATLEALDRSLAVDRVTAGGREGLERERDLWQEKRAAAEERAADTRAERGALLYDPEAFAKVSLAASEAQRARDAAKIKHARAEEAVRAANDRRQRAEQVLDAYDQRARALEELTDRLRVTGTAADRLADFRVSVASGIRPEMEELVSGFVGILTDGRYEAVTLSEDFDCQLHRAGVGLEVISGGEEDVVAVAMRLATSQMIAERAGHPLSLLVLDEPFGSQDEVRRGNMLALFRRLQSVFPQIVLISHVPESQHQVDHAVVVEFDEAAGACRVLTHTAAEAAEGE